MKTKCFQTKTKKTNQFQFNEHLILFYLGNWEKVRKKVNGFIVDEDQFYV